MKMTTVTDKTFPPVSELLPHKPPMMLVDECLSWGEDAVSVRAVIDDKCHLFLESDGTCGSWLILELMAQTVGVFAGLKNRAQGQAPKVGFLLGTRRFETTIGRLKKGDEVIVDARCIFLGQEGLPSQFECTARMNDKVAATANLTVYEPENLQTWTN